MKKNKNTDSNTMNSGISQIRLRDIAEDVGFSIPVVSKVLNSGKSNSAASPQAAALIREAAARMGYVRNRAATSLKKGQQDAIGVLLHPMGAPGSELTLTFLEGVSSELTDHGQRLELGFYHSKDEFHRQLQRMGPTVVDGLIIAGVPSEELHDSLQQLAHKGMPVVTVHSRSICSEIPNVLCDESEMLYLATKHLIEFGCKNIAQVGYWQKRSAGFEKAMTEAQLPHGEHLIYRPIAGKFDPQMGEDAVATFNYRGVKFDGLVCQTDTYAIGAMRAILQHGQSIPGDIKIIGVDNTPFCRFAPVPLSSVSLELTKRARQAVKMLMNIRSGENVKSQTIAPKLIPRASTIGRKENV